MGTMALYTIGKRIINFSGFNQDISRIKLKKRKNC